MSKYGYGLTANDIGAEPEQIQTAIVQCAECGIDVEVIVELAGSKDVLCAECDFQAECEFNWAMEEAELREQGFLDE